MFAEEFKYGFGKTTFQNFIFVVSGFVDNEKDSVKSFEGYDVLADVWK